MKTLNILLIEDNPLDVRIVKELLKDTHLFNYNLFAEQTLKNSLIRMQNNSFDVILMDLNLPDSKGTQTFETIFGLYPESNIILVSGLEDEELSLELIQMGAQDYLPKSNIDSYTFERSIRYSIERNKQNIKIKENLIRINKSEQSMLESEEKYRLLAECSPEAIFLIDLNGYLTYVNPAAALQLNAKPSEIIGKHINDVFSPEMARENLAEVQNIISTKQPFYSEREMSFPSGNIWLANRLTPVFDHQNQVVAVLGLSLNITKQRQAEKEIRKLSRAVEHGAACVVITNREGDIEYVNQKFCELTGYSKEEAFGKNPRILNAGYQDKNFYEEFWNTLLKGNNWSGEILNKKKNGDLYWESALISPLLNDRGEITNFVAIKDDITDKKNMISQLIESKEKAESANKLKDAFIANISHEIRTPLNGILGMSSLIKDLFRDNIKKEDEELFDGIEFSSSRIIRTIDMILNYSRLQVGEFMIKPGKINISNICASLAHEFNIAAKSKSLEFTFLNNCGDTVVFADEYSIIMAISNLVDNAIKFTNKGSISLTLNKGIGDDIIIEVKDTGIGIDKNYLNFIFEPYRQEQMGYGRAYEGIGLGLAIVKKVLNMNNAVITVESKKGQGTTFCINLGLGEQPIEDKLITAPAPGILPAKKIQKQQKMVLLVEDDLMNQITITKFIGRMHKVIVTDSSDEAMEIINKEKIDLILMDISINGSRDGLELTTILKSSTQFSNIPVIVTTAHAFKDDKDKALEAGCNSYLAKPFTKEVLLNMINLFIN